MGVRGSRRGPLEEEEKRLFREAAARSVDPAYSFFFAREILRKAGALVGRGFCQGVGGEYLGHVGVKHSVPGALRLAFEFSGECGIEAMGIVLRCLARAAGIHAGTLVSTMAELERWNDCPGRTVGDAVRLFERASVNADDEQRRVRDGQGEGE